ncbi:MAG: hypothetical protein K2V38_26015, partial [Gemmataceae bacterium]|nr:hypothetical protein [Gemmataceae bacterium]
AFAAVNFDLATVLVKRQLLLNVEIPRGIQLRDESQDVWPVGAEVELRYKVTGAYTPDMVGRVRVEPDGQPEEFYDLVYEKDAPDGAGAYFVTRLPPSSVDFSFSARLDSGRTRASGRVRFEPPPQLSSDSNAITAEQILPLYLGTKPGTKEPFGRKNDGWNRGDVNDALPGSQVIVLAQFNKPVRQARLVPVVLDGAREKDYAHDPARHGPRDFQSPRAYETDRRSAQWLFPTAPGMVGYRLELVDDRGFVNSVPIRRNVRMLEDRPPVVTFMPESTRHPDPEEYDGKPEGKAAHEWGDRLPLAEGGRVMVVYNARSDQGIDPNRAFLAYRVVPRGVAPDAFPQWWQDVQHPRQDWDKAPNLRVFERLPLKAVTPDLTKTGAFVPDLGLFEKSWQGLSRLDRFRTNVELYAFPSPAPDDEPAGLEAGGRYMFEVERLVKKVPDGNGGMTTAKLEIGDTVELYVEIYDRNPAPGRSPGHPKEARRKIVVNAEDAAKAIKSRDEENRKLQDKLRDLAADQANVFRQTNPTPPMDPKK